jgi:DNA transformation protein
MAVSESFKTFVLEQLRASEPVTSRAMFGGVGLYCRGAFFGLIAEDVLYFKVDDSSRREFEQAGSRPFRPYGEESYSMQYYEVPADVLEDRERLSTWREKAVAVAQRSATAGSRKPKRPKG